MNDPVIVWIIDDSKTDAYDAWREVEKVRDKCSDRADVYWAANFDWYPAFRAGVNPVLAVQKTAEYPDIVILDLCFATSQGEVLRGDGFYQELRRWEVHKPEGRPAFVIFWSLYQGRQDTDKFVRHTVHADTRVIPLASKRSELLLRTVANLWHRVREEREG